MTNLPKISKRLQCAGGYVREGSFLADVGTDHAYLPIALMAEGRIRGGVVSDINKGPLERACAHVREWGMEQTLTPLLCDGLSALEPYAPEDILILGMGGELIADILARAPWTKKEGIRLILQPMTHPEILRRFLVKNGYGIVGESLVREEKIYQILCAEYTGQSADYTELELMFGKQNLSRMDELTLTLLCRWEQILEERRRGKRSAGADTAEEDTLLQEIGGLKA
ncbi:MAG: SAM-dependent methyltransferase [Clostridia bacterium]|nr:SAM-dependent methyltransferase [Clostridia bacterium]